MSGISGVGGAQGFDLQAVDGDAAEAAEAPKEAQVVRGGAPSAGAMIANAVSDMSAKKLETELRAAGMTKTEAKKEAKAIKKTAAEIEKLEAKLKALEAKQAALIKQRDDPTISWWSKGWVEWDLADVHWEIAKVKRQLGTLETKLDKACHKFFDDAFATLSFMSKIRRFFTRESDSAVDRSQREREEALARRRKEMDEAEQRARRGNLLADQGYIRPAPPDSEFVRDEIQRIALDLEKGRIRRTAQEADALRQRVSELRDRAEAAASE